MNASVHPPGVAGLFYPRNPNELSRLIDEMIGSGTKVHEGQINAIIAPHAGYVYSGSTAAKAYIHLQGLKFDEVILLGPTHRVYYPGVALHKAHYFETPLGRLELNHHALEDLCKNVTDAAYASQVFEQEHCLEVHLPFLQKVLPSDFQILPILLGDVSQSIMDELACWIRSYVQSSGKKVLIVASTDFSHFFSAPRAQEMDFLGKDWILKHDAKRLLEANQNHQISLCGINAVYTTMQCFPTQKIQFLEYSHSGMTSGDNSSVVGYMSFLVQG